MMVVSAADEASSAGFKGALADRPPQPSLMPLKPVAVFGEDDRVMLPPDLERAAEGVGLLFNRRTGAVCTAFCLADSVIATAAHCLYRPTGTIAPRLGDVWFARGYDRVRDFARIQGHDRAAAAQSVIAGTERVSTDPPITATRDWALVRMSRPVCAGRSLPAVAMDRAGIAAAAEAGRLFQLAYHRDFQQWRPAYSKPCALWKPAEPAAVDDALKEFAEPEHLMLHTCDTGGGSSGSPLLVREPGGRIVVAGLNVGTYVQARSLLQNGEFVRRLEPEVVANSSIASVAFVGRVAALQSARVLATRDGVRALQAALSRQGHYAGPIDGSFTAAVRSAIERYEASAALTISGIASQALLERLLRR
jgi:protease YdgD